MNEKKSDPEFPDSYYPIQVMLAVVGMVVGFGVCSWLFDYKGKPDLEFYIVPMVLAIWLVRIHRSYTIKRLKGKKPFRCNGDRE